ncbi:MAG TPA: hypothetical protein VGE39_05925, partial [Prosthecobacter sp.]
MRFFAPTALLLLPWLIHSAFVIPHSAFAVEPPTAPILRIESEMHTAPIRSMAVDAAGKVALTASKDKTARLWEVSSAKLLQVLRPPQGEEDEGALNACALSPDGTLAAVAGWTGADWDQSNSIYLFDTATGRLQRRITGLPNLVFGLAFSKNGGFLAAVGAGWGLRMWETRGWAEVGRDTEYDDSDSYGVDWHGDDKLVTTCDDGNLRLYGVEAAPGSAAGWKMRLRSLAPTRSGEQPFSASFSPDGSRIAVGFQDSAAVAVHDGSALDHLFSPDSSDVKEGNLHHVAWNHDGTVLAASGTWAQDNDLSPMRFWTDGGKGAHKDRVVAKNTVLDIGTLPNGEFVYVAGDPCLGRVWPSPEGDIQVSVVPTPLADHRDSQDKMLLSEDGTMVAFGYEQFAKSPARFSLATRELQVETDSQPLPAVSQKLHAAVTTGLPITEWDYHTRPLLDGEPLPMADNEKSLSLAIAHNAAGFVMGTNWHLRNFNAQGAERWRIAPASHAWAVNLTHQDRLTVASFDDGTIRWHRTSDGKELLAFYPHADRKRWVLWTSTYRTVKTDVPLWGANWSQENGEDVIRNVRPNTPASEAGLKDGDVFAGFLDEASEANLKRTSGTVYMKVERDGRRLDITATMRAAQRDEVQATYYDCSPEGEGLIGWHVNRGKEQAADFYPAAKFRDQCYRPDIINELIKDWDLAAAIGRANARRPAEPASALPMAEIIAKSAPPVVELSVGGPSRTLELPADATEATLTYRVRGGGTPVSQMRVLLNSRPVDVRAPIPADDTNEATVTIPLPAQDCVLALLAGNRHSFSEPAILHIRRTGTATTTLQKGTLYVLAVGVSKLKNQATLADLDALEYADDDAVAFHKVLAAQTKLYRKIESRLLLDDQATAGDVLDGLDWIKASTTPADTSMVLLAGHGESDERNGRYAFCAHDYDRARRQRTGVGFEDIKLTLAAAQGEVLLFLD